MQNKLHNLLKFRILRAWKTNRQQALLTNNNRMRIINLKELLEILPDYPVKKLENLIIANWGNRPNN